VTAKKCDCNFSVKIKVLNFNINFSGHFKNPVAFMNLIFFKFTKSGFSICDWDCVVYGRRLDRAAQHQLDVDCRNKQHAQLVDERMHRLNNQSIELAYHDGVEYHDDTSV